jgi:DeoR family transcriptional regulator, aga operon transcriptional repressor
MVTVDDSFRYGSAPTRRRRIVDLLSAASFMGASELAETLGVSEMTIRRDIRLLADQGLVRSVHGGVTPVARQTFGTDFRLRSTLQHEAKVAVAATALGMIESGCSIAIDNGTTGVELAMVLRPPLQLSVVTPSLPVMVVLRDTPGIELVGLGGVLHSESQGFAGPATLLALSKLRVNQVFLAATAIGRGALWCGNAWDAETKRELVRIADEVILLADSSKFESTAMSTVIPLSAVDTLVVDDGIRDEDRATVEAEGVRVLIAHLGPDRSPNPADGG